MRWKLWLTIRVLGEWFGVTGLRVDQYMKLRKHNAKPQRTRETEKESETGGLKTPVRRQSRKFADWMFGNFMIRMGN